MIRLRNVRLASKFVFLSDPGVWKKVTNNKARCIFGPQDLYGEEAEINPDAEVFVIDDPPPPRETLRIPPPSGNEGVRVVFEDAGENILLDRVVPWQDAMAMAQSDVVVVRSSPSRKEIWDIGEVGFDVEEHALCFEVFLRRSAGPQPQKEEKPPVGRPVEKPVEQKLEEVPAEKPEGQKPEEEKHEDRGTTGEVTGNV